MKFGNAPHLGLLIIRIGLGCAFMAHGFPKLAGGPDLWAKIGASMGYFGITFAPAAWGLMAGLAEFVGGLFLVLGLLFPYACAALTFTMVVAATSHILGGDGFIKYSHSLEAGVVFLGLLFAGPGRFKVNAAYRAAGVAAEGARMRVVYSVQRLRSRGPSGSPPQSIAFTASAQCRTHSYMSLLAASSLPRSSSSYKTFR